MTKIYDGMRVTVNEKSTGWICHINYIERLRTPEYSGKIVFREEYESETCKRLGGHLEVRGGSINVRPGVVGTVRRMVFYGAEQPRPLPPWLEFHKSNPKFEEWKDGFYAREGKTFFGELGLYADQEPPEGAIHRYGVWVIEFDDIPITKEDGYAGFLGLDDVLPDYLEEVK
jgi:hypothetical protein